MPNATIHRRSGLTAMLSLALSLAVAIDSSAAAPQASGQKAAPYTLTVPNSVVKVNMVPVPGGTVKIEGKDVAVKPFYMAATETPWELFDLFLQSGPPSKPYDQTEFAADVVARPSRSYILPDLGWGHRGYPTINVSIDNVEMFCRWLSSVTGKKYRLPTEAEWELAARGGKPTPVKLDAATVDKQSWNAANSKETTQPVGKKSPNALGIYDLLGNASEWAMDINGKPVLCGPSFRDPANSVSTSVRKRWEPSWQETDPQVPKSRWWLSDAPFAGFRVVCEG